MFTREDLTCVFNEISSSSLKELRIFEGINISTINSEIFSLTITSLEKVIFFTFNQLTSKQTKSLFNDIIIKSHKLQYLDLNYMNIQDTSPEIFLSAIKRVKSVRFMWSSGGISREPYAFLNNLFKDNMTAFYRVG